jgi:hypothetical protein
MAIPSAYRQCQSRIQTIHGAAMKWSRPNGGFIIKKYLRKDQNGYRIVRSSVYREYFIETLAHQGYRSGAADADEPSPATKRVGVGVIKFPRFL